MSKKKDKKDKKEEKETKVTSEKPVSLFPLDFKDALRGLLATPPLKEKKVKKAKKDK